LRLGREIRLPLGGSVGADDHAVSVIAVGALRLAQRTLALLGRLDRSLRAIDALEDDE
jgi:hypothetical protein